MKNNKLCTNVIGGGTQATSVRRRDSSIECLRIVAMLLVLLIHYLPARMVPTPETMASVPWQTFLELELRSISFVCVNVFILISGWFGIRWRRSSFSRLIAQIVFWGVAATAVADLFTTQDVRWWTYAANTLTIFRQWFVFCYLGLYLLAPMINSYIESVEVRALGRFVAIYYAFSIFFGYFCYGVFNNPTDFLTGMSILSLMGLYLLGAWLRRSDWRWLHLPAGAYLLAYLGLGLLQALFAAALLKVGFTKSPYGYLNPVILLESVCLFLFFARLRMGHVGWVNWLASSAFAAYLLHCSPAVGRYFSDSFDWVEATFAYSLPVALVWLALIYLIAVLIDKCWQAVYGRIAGLCGE